jgi:Flagellar hook capping protein
MSTTTAMASPTVSKDEFLKLFVAQLKNQSPMDPLKGHEFIAQLAQFSSVEQLTSLNASFADTMKFQQLTGGSEFIGKKATFVDPTLEGTAEGVIQGVKILDNSISVVIGNKEIPIANVTGIFENK